MQEAAVGLQHERTTTSDSIRLPLTAAFPGGLTKYWVLTNVLPNQIPQVWKFTNQAHFFRDTVDEFYYVTFCAQVTTIYTLPTTTANRIEDGKVTVPTSQSCLTAIPSSEPITLIGEHRVTSSSAQHPTQVWFLSESYIYSPDEIYWSIFDSFILTESAIDYHYYITAVQW